MESLCVSDGAGGVHRSLFGNDRGLTAYIERSQDRCQYHWGGNIATSTPAAAVWAGEPLMVYTALERGLYEFEAVAARWDLTACQPFPMVRDSIPGTPESIMGGDLDGDGELDLVSLVTGIGLDDTGTPVARRFVWASLSTAYRNERLAGTSKPISQPGNHAATYDANGDGYDDVAIFSEESVAIYPMGPLQ